MLEQDQPVQAKHIHQCVGCVPRNHQWQRAAIKIKRAASNKYLRRAIGTELPR